MDINDKTDDANIIDSRRNLVNLYFQETLTVIKMIMVNDNK
jgi:hypothetical protein